ncbi:MAG: hypothetical protein ACI8WB_004227, partial [Phenylobacterium sp.]
LFIIKRCSSLSQHGDLCASKFNMVSPLVIRCSGLRPVLPITAGI